MRKWRTAAGEVGVVGETDSKQCKLCRKQHASLARATSRRLLARLGGGGFPSEYVACWERQRPANVQKAQTAIVFLAAEGREISMLPRPDPHATTQQGHDGRRPTTNEGAAGRVHSGGRNGGAWHSMAWLLLLLQRRCCISAIAPCAGTGWVNSGVTAAFLFADIPTLPTGDWAGLGWLSPVSPQAGQAQAWRCCFV